VHSALTPAACWLLDASPFGPGTDTLASSSGLILTLLSERIARKGKTIVTPLFCAGIGIFTKFDSPERQALLEAIPGWFWGTKSDYVWNQKLALLKKFAEQEGHARPSYGHIEGGVKLGSWVFEQRAERQNLSAERKAALEALPGWSWTVSQDAWDEKYEMLKKFAAREGPSVSMTQDNYMARNRVHTEVAELLDRAISDE
jgi:hypothetical protein